MDMPRVGRAERPSIAADGPRYEGSPTHRDTLDQLGGLFQDEPDVTLGSTVGVNSAIAGGVALSACPFRVAQPLA
jgi:hypothetical protein